MSRLLFLLFFILLIWSSFNYSFLIDFFDEYKNILIQYVELNFWQSLIAFFIIYTITIILAVPTSGVLTILGGALFGFYIGVVVNSLANAIGATGSLILCRKLFHNYIVHNFSSKLHHVRVNFARDHLRYLFFLRLVPFIPFIMLNIIMSIMPISVRNFYLVSQIGVIPGVAIYTYAGEKLMELESMGDILTIEIIFILFAIGLLPFLINKSFFYKSHQ